MRSAKRTQPLYPKFTRKLPELKQKEQTVKTRFPRKSLFHRVVVPLATLILLTLLGSEFVKKQRDEQLDSSQEDTLHDFVKKRSNRRSSLAQEDITQRLVPLISESQGPEQPTASQEDTIQRLAPLISESQEDEQQPTASQEDITQSLAPLISKSQEDEQSTSLQEDIAQSLAPLTSESQEEEAYSTSVETKTQPQQHASRRRGRTEHSPDPPRLPTKRLLRRIGVALTILIVLSIAGKALYDSLSF